MKYTGTTFFVYDGIYAHVGYDPDDKVWPIAVFINNSIDKDYAEPDIRIFLKNKRQLIALKNSLIGACEGMEKEGA